MLRKSFQAVFIVSSAILMVVVRPAFADAPKEMWEEPSHQLVFEKGTTRILDIRVVPGVVSEYHSHRFATAYVIVQDARVNSQRTGGDWVDLSSRDRRPAGAINDRADYLTKPYVHRVDNIDDRTLHLVAVVNSAALTSDEPIELTPEGDRLDNPYFAEHRYSVAANGRSEQLRFDNETLVVQAHAGPSHILEDGVSHSSGTAPGAWSWHAPGTAYRIVNNSDDAREFVVLEIKTP